MDGRECRATAALGVVALAAGAAFAACASARYAPCPVELSTPLPADAFARCRDALRRRYGSLEVADATTFRLQSSWCPVQDPAGERRATVFRDGEAGDDLAVVVEVRWLTVPLIGVPAWTEPRGDAAAERELAAALREALAVEVAGR